MVKCDDFKFERRKMIKNLIAGSILLAATSLFALSEGKEYFKLSDADALPNAQGTVIELFSYMCIHCYNQYRANTVQTLSELLPDYKIEEWQVREMGKYGGLLAKILVYAASLDRVEGYAASSPKSYSHKIVGSYFEAHFKYRMRWASDEEFAKIALNIINEKRAKKATLSDIEAFVKEDGKAALNRVHHAINVAKKSGTPAFVVNGKYLVNVEEVDDQEELLSIVKELTQMK